MALAFTEDNEKTFQGILSRYPNDRRRAALLPTLHLAQRQFGYLATEVQEYVATRLQLQASEVMNTVTFYTMFRKRACGRNHVQVCTNLSCYLRGSDELMAQLEELLGVTCGETTEDGLFTLDHVECLASCGTAPMMQVNDDYHENLTPQKVAALVDTLRRS